MSQAGIRSLTLLAVAGSLLAEDAGPPAAASAAARDELATIVVTASRSPEEAKRVPQAVTVLSREAIAERQARTPNQMLREEPGIWSVQVAAQGSPIIRGQIGNRVVYLWDGIRINNGALFGGPNGFFNQFPVGSVERMEVLRGPAAVQYGSDAIGGAVNVIGKQADPFANPDGTHGDAGIRFGTNDGEFTSYSDLSVVDGRLAAVAGISGQAVGDYHAPAVGQIENTGYRALGGHAGVGFRVTPDQTIRLSFVGNDRDNVETYTQSKLNPGGIPRIYGPFERRWIAKGEYEIDRLAPASDRLKAYAYRQDYAQRRVNTNESGTAIATTTTDADQQVTGLGVQNTGHAGAARLTIGSDARFETLASDKSLSTYTKATGATVATVPNGNIPDGSYDVQDLFAITDLPLARSLGLRLGGRYERTHLASAPAPEDALTPFTVDDLELDKSWNAVTGSVGMLWDLGRTWSLAGNVATGFRAPTFNDTLSTGVPVFASGIASVPSPDVGPERSISYELALRHDSEAAWGSLTGYYTDLHDLITSQANGTIAVPGVGTVTAMENTNSGRGFVTGAEFEAGLRLTACWTVFGNATWTYGQDTVNHVPLRFIPPLNGVLGLRRDSEDRRWWGEGVVVLVDRLRRHAPNDELDAGFATDPGLGSPNATTNPPYRDDWRLPGYAVVNLRGGWRVCGSETRHLDLTANLNNALDRSYREAYSQQQLLAPGRNLVVGLEGSF